MSYLETGSRVSVVPHTDLSALPFDSGLVLIDPRRDQMLAYNESAAIVWRAIENGALITNAVAALSNAYGISEPRGLADASAIIRHWMDLDLLENSTGAPPSAENAAPATVFDIGPERIVTFCIRGHYFRIAIAEQSIAKHLNGLLAAFVVDNLVSDGNDADSDFTVRVERGALAFRIDGTERLRSDRPPEIIGALLQAIIESHGLPFFIAPPSYGTINRSCLRGAREAARQRLQPISVQPAFPMRRMILRH